MQGFGTNAQAVVVAFQRNFFVAATRKKLRVHSELLGPVAGHSAADGKNAHAFGSEHGVGKFLKIFEGIEAQQRPLVSQTKNLVKREIDAQLRIREGRDENRDIFLVSGL